MHHSFKTNPRFAASALLTQYTFFYILLFLGLLTVARVLFITAYGGESFDSLFLMDTFYWGVRIDLRTASISCFLFYLIAQLVVMFNPNAILKTMTYYKMVLLWLLYFGLILMVVNHYYYQNFQNHIDIFIFEFLDWENTKAVSQTIWQDYPVISGLLFLLFMAWFCSVVLFQLQVFCKDRLWVPQKRFFAFYVVAALLSLMLMVRGSVGTFPLTLAQISIAGDLLLNRAVANGPIAFAVAAKEWRNMQTVKPVSDKDFKEAYETWFDQPYTDGADVFTIQKTPQAKVSHLPNVVVVQMESLGAHVASLQAADNDLLGALAKHKTEDYWFQNFLSSTKGTLNSVEKLLTNAGLRNISQSSYRKTEFATAPASVFKQLGYHTVFLTSGAKKWSNLEQFLPHQGFDEMIDAQDIKAIRPDVQEDGSWGLFDGFTFEYLTDYLQKKHDKPVFVYMMTITNHSPYILPDGYEGSSPLHVPEEYQAKVFKGNMEKANLVMKTYQYASNELGKFMNRIKGSSLKNETIVAATGDHYMRDLFNYYTEASDVLNQYTVPLYLYLPDDFKAGTAFDKTSFGSHKDIFPTIFARLTAQQPLLTGNDLLARETSAIGISEEFAFSEHGAVLNLGKNPIFYQWSDEKKEKLVQTSTPIEALLELNKKHKAYDTLLRWNTVQTIERQKKK